MKSVHNHGPHVLLQALTELCRTFTFRPAEIECPQREEGRGKGGALTQPGMEVHRSWELKALYRGEHVFLVEGRELRRRAPALLLLRPEIVHHVDAYRLAPGTKLFCCTLENASVAHMDAARYENFFLTPADTGRWAEFLHAPPGFEVEHTLALSEQRSEICDDLISSRWRAFFASLALTLEHAAPPTPSGQQATLDRCMALINGNYGAADLAVTDLARHLGTSTRRLRAVFHKQTGRGVRQTLIRVRLEKAYNLLQTGRFSVKEVAFSTGWKRPAYFSTCFTRCYGFPPSRVRHDASSRS